MIARRLLCVGFALSVAGFAYAQEATPPDLAVGDIAIKSSGGSKKQGAVRKINNVSIQVQNLGQTNAKNSRLEVYLSDDTTLSTETTVTTDTMTTITADTLIAKSSLGTVKAGWTKKKTIGGGLINRYQPVKDKYLLFFVDAQNQIKESDEANNIKASNPLP